MTARHFLTLLDLSPGELESVIARAIAMKADPQGAGRGTIAPNHRRALGFESCRKIASIARRAADLSTVGMPVRAEVIGPMVDPHGRSARCSAVPVWPPS